MRDLWDSPAAHESKELPWGSSFILPFQLSVFSSRHGSLLVLRSLPTRLRWPPSSLRWHGGWEFFGVRRNSLKRPNQRKWRRCRASIQRLWKQSLGCCKVQVLPRPAVFPNGVFSAFHLVAHKLQCNEMFFSSIPFLLMTIASQVLAPSLSSSGLYKPLECGEI
jgi:hypothetical protein